MRILKLWTGRGLCVQVSQAAREYRTRDFVSASCVKDDDGKILVEEDKLMEVWRSTL